MHSYRSIRSLIIVMVFVLIGSVGYYAGEPGLARSLLSPYTLENSALYPGRQNIALGKPVIVSVGQVVYKDYAVLYNPQNITDGDDTLGWRTQTDSVAEESRARAIIDLQGHYRIGEVSHVVNWDSQAGFDQQIQFRISTSNADAVSLDRIEYWTELVTVNLVAAENSQKIFHRVFPTDARFIKVEYIAEDSEWAGWGNIQEIEVYPTPDR